MRMGRRGTYLLVFLRRARPEDSEGRARDYVNLLGSMFSEDEKEEAREEREELVFCKRDGMSVSADVAVDCVVFKSTQSIKHVGNCNSPLWRSRMHMRHTEI